MYPAYIPEKFEPRATYDICIYMYISYKHILTNTCIKTNLQGCACAKQKERAIATNI